MKFFLLWPDMFAVTSASVHMNNAPVTTSEMRTSTKMPAIGSKAVHIIRTLNPSQGFDVGRQWEGVQVIFVASCIHHVVAVIIVKAILFGIWRRIKL